MRRPTEFESGMLQHIVGAVIPEREALVSQLPDLLVEPIDPEGSLKLIPRCGQAALYRCRVPVEAWAEDLDGVRIFALLHLRQDGRLDELEIYKADGTPIRRLPPAEAWNRVVNPEGLSCL